MTFADAIFCDAMESGGNENVDCVKANNAIIDLFREHVVLSARFFAENQVFRRKIERTNKLWSHVFSVVSDF